MPWRIVLVAAAVLGLIASPTSASADDADGKPRAIRADVMENPPVPHLFRRHDLAFLGATVLGVTVAVHNDQWLTNRAIGNQGNEARQKIADLFQPLPYVAVATAGGLYAYGRWGGHPILARRAGRAGISVMTAAVVAVGLKTVFGRFRPLESPDDPFRFEPFSGHASFPSGHATLAFASAVALDRETTSGWVPWVAYPVATMVAWSRVHDLKHWTSDVVAGAAIGGWTAWKTESFLEGRALGVPDAAQKTSLLVVPRDGAMELVVTSRF
jgi:membrane-associated phospholipid phosphatase